MGCPTVMIGEVGMASPGPMSAGATMVAMSQVQTDDSESATALALASQGAAATVPLNPAYGLGNGGSDSQNADTTDKKVWVEIQLLDTDNKPVPNEAYHIELPDGTSTDGCTDDKGMARVDGIDPGNCKISFPNLDKKSWKKK
jgi:type VI secretion system secreted protein VgrG